MKFRDLKAWGEPKITIKYFKKRISFNIYQSLLRKIEEERYWKEINQKGDKMSMSSTKWK